MSIVDSDFVSGGVVMFIGELVLERGECKYDGEPGIVKSVERFDICEFCLRILSCKISASILRSESSSRSLCASTRNLSRSCSPSLISSSSITPRSIAMLYLDSRSSRDDVVCRAWRSMSSLATSMSRSLSWSVRLASRRDVISFSRLLCAALASALDSLYFLCKHSVSQPGLVCIANGRWNLATNLPFLYLEAQPFNLLSQCPLPLVGCLQILLELGL